MSYTRKVAWQEPGAASKRWKGTRPKIEILYDPTNAFLLKVFIHIDRNEGIWTQRTLQARGHTISLGSLPCLRSPSVL